MSARGSAAAMAHQRRAGCRVPGPEGRTPGRRPQRAVTGCDLALPSEDDGARGDAVDWALEHDLALAQTDSMGALTTALGQAGSDDLAVDLREPGSAPRVLVNGEGRRFTDETQVFSLVVAGDVEDNEPAWRLVTREWLEAIVPEAEQDVIEELACAADWATLAGRIEVDTSGLEQTLSELNGFEREALDGTPCAFRPGFVAAKGFGGLDVDEQQRVLGTDGQPIRGLYAVGEAAGMAVPGLGGRYGFDGSLSAVVWSGWRAAAAIQAELEGDSG